MDGPTFICTEGWDWVPGIRDRNIGIWQSVELQRSGSVRLTDPYVITDLPLPDTSSADITISATLTNSSSKEQSATINGKIGEVTFSKDNTEEEAGRCAEAIATKGRNSPSIAKGLP